MKFLNFILVLIFSVDAFSQRLARPTYPVSISVKTASYTIPANRWARATVEVDSGGIFTIDGVNALTSAGFINVSGSSAANTATLHYTVPSNYKFTIAAAGTSVGSSTAYFNSQTAVVMTETNSGFVRDLAGAMIGPAGVLSIANVTAANKHMAGLGEPSNALNRLAMFFLPPGTVINGSGNWRATIEEYIP